MLVMTFREIWWLLKEPFVCVGRLRSLTAKSVQGTALSFQSVHNIHGCDSLSLGVLGVCHSITDHVLKENFENTTSLLVDQARDSLDTATASKTTDGWLDMHHVTQFTIKLPTISINLFAYLRILINNQKQACILRLNITFTNGASLATTAG